MTPQIYELLNQVIDLAKKKDLQHHADIQATWPPWKTRVEPQGDDSVVFHLKQLRDLLKEENKRLENVVVPNDHNPKSESSFEMMGRNPEFIAQCQAGLKTIVDYRLENVVVPNDHNSNNVGGTLVPLKDYDTEQPIKQFSYTD